MSARQSTAQTVDQLAGQLPLPFAARRTAPHPTKLAALVRRIPDRWELDGACADAKDPEAWFPLAANSHAAAAAIRICRGCPVRRACLASGLLNREAGIWGGTTEPDRAAALAALATVNVDVALDRTLAAAEQLADDRVDQDAGAAA